ncbi:MAG TPA: hypothetical protein EYP40_05400 [Chromatiales bacterium]|nr:hypothetical protein [Chromatiales bacterium]
MPDILDISLAIEQAGGNAELARDLFSMLLDELPHHRDKLRQAFEAGDQQALWDHAHKVYGATAYCGVPALREAAGELETAIKSRSSDLGDRLTTVIRAMEALLENGAAHLEQHWA